MSMLADTDLAGLGLDELLSLGGEAPAAPIAPEAPDVPDAAPRGAVAVIGLSARIAGCADLDAFWQLLCDARATRRALPPAREADVREYLRLRGAHAPQWLRGSFLDEVDRFDHRFFGLARQEAHLMDPNQRLFLETAWAALEHAGHGGAAVRGSATGLFVGFSADFGDAYRDIVRAHAPDAPEVAVVGNVKSLIASRLAYHLDLRGPSLLVDTACSSGLVALHLACRALAAGDCDMAVAGAVKVDLVPAADDPGTGTGVKDLQATNAHDGRTRTFDESGAGTSGAEGVLAFVLKPLERALADGDTVHAVLRGSAVNQDGLSVGITAPNMAAQEALITRALDAAGVAADSISLLEAHGTATKLGDPIEVGAIARAFARQTRRRQFCAIGSVKSNVGHLDNAAGLAGLAKVVLALRHGQIPATQHFGQPNRKIAFETSPVYVNDVLRPWRTEPGVPRRAGISSFGLSGTNCHVIVEEAPAPAPRAAAAAAGPWLLVLSALTGAALARLLRAWSAHLEHAPGLDAADACFTAATGRLHHGHRVALCFESPAQLRAQLQALAEGGPGGAGAGAVEGVSAGAFRRVGDRRVAEGEAGLLDDARKQQLDAQARALTDRLAHTPAGDAAARAALLREAAGLYVAGADFEWERWWTPGAARRVPLPTYPFERTRCWVATTPAGERLAARGAAKTLPHPLLDRRAADSLGLRVYEAALGPDTHWELGEHRVQGRCVLPGTALVEMLAEAAAQESGGGLAPLALEQLVFLQPLALAPAPGARRVAQVVLDDAAGDGESGWRARVLSRAEDGAWETHAEGRLRRAAGTAPAPLDLDALRAALPEGVPWSQADDAARGLALGARWSGCVQGAWSNAARDTLLVRLRLAEAHQGDAGRYHAHPALLDNAVNAMNHLAGAGELYLPLSYGRLALWRALPAEFWALLRRQQGGGREAFVLDVTLAAPDGTVCAQAGDYTVKRVGEAAGAPDAAAAWLHALRLVPELDAALPLPAPPDAPVLLVHGGDAAGAALARCLREAGVALLEATPPAAAREAGDWSALLAPLEGRTLGGVVYAAHWSAGDEDGANAPRDTGDSAALRALAAFAQALGVHRLRCRGALLLLTRGAFAVGAAGADPDLDAAVPACPRAAALAALARIARLENPQLRWRCLDSDQLPEAPRLLAELAPTPPGQPDADLAVWRGALRHREQLHTLPVPESARFTPRADGFYLITGGTGALGLELAALMAARGPVRLALLGSTPLPPAPQWPALREAADTPAPLRATLRRLAALEAAGARVRCVAADVADAAALASALDALRAEWGALHGVAHCAGRAGDGFIQRKPLDTFERVVAPKVEGARLLHALTRGDALDFFILYSSVATSLRSPGQGDYTAGNAWMEALARQRRAQGLPALAVCWPAWRDIGIAAAYGAVDEDEFFAPIAPAEARALMEAFLCDRGALPPVVVAARLNPRADTGVPDALGIDLPEATRAALRRAGARRDKAAAGATAGADAAVALRGLEAPDEAALAVAALWGRILGVSELGADDAFADHGGNSILTTQLYREYEALYPGALDVVDLFTHATVREQAAALRRALDRTAAPSAPSRAVAPASGPAPAPVPAADAAPDLDTILARLAEGSISAEEAEAFLAAK